MAGRAALVVMALDAEGEKLIPSVEFEVSGGSSETKTTITTDGTGKASTPVEPGRYEIRCTKAPGYDLPDPQSKTVSAGSSPRPVTFHLGRSATLQVSVVSAAEGADPRPVPNAEVTVRPNSGAEPTKAVTDDKGVVTFALTPGQYWVEHPVAPAGFRRSDDEPRPVGLAAGELKTETFTDVPLGSLLVKVFDADGKPVVGASLLVKRDPAPAKSGKTGDDGIFQTELDAGVYSVTQTEPAATGFLLPAEDAATKPAVVGPGAPATVEFRNVRPATITVKAVRKDDPTTAVAGAK